MTSTVCVCVCICILITSWLSKVVLSYFQRFFFWNMVSLCILIITVLCSRTLRMLHPHVRWPSGSNDREWFWSVISSVLFMIVRDAIEWHMISVFLMRIWFEGMCMLIACFCVEIRKLYMHTKFGLRSR